ncbi:MAG: hypothetical protein WCF62_00790 [Pseudolabrys sp.]
MSFLINYGCFSLSVLNQICSFENGLVPTSHQRASDCSPRGAAD